MWGDFWPPSSVLIVMIIINEFKAFDGKEFSAPTNTIILLLIHPDIRRIYSEGFVKVVGEVKRSTIKLRFFRIFTIIAPKTPPQQVVALPPGKLINYSINVTTTCCPWFNGYT